MRVLGVDYGRRRIGLAVSDASGMLARPWKTIARVGNPGQVAGSIVAEVNALGREDQSIGVIVIGYPRRLNGEPNEQTAAVEQMADSLRRLVEIPLVLQDERLSSHEADGLLARSQKDWRRRKAQLDAMSAAVILQDYLDSDGARDIGRQREDSET